MTQGKTIVVVSHEPEIAKYCKRILTFKDGQIISDGVVRDYYECLFKKDACDEDSVGEALEALERTLSREDRDRKSVV